MNATEILNSQMFRRLRSRSIRILQDPIRFSRIISQVGDKLNDKSQQGNIANDFVEEMGTVVRMLKAYIRQDYTAIPWKSLLLLTAGCLYFLMPFDAIPDFIPVSGFLDDVSLIFWILGTIQQDINAFKEWEAQARQYQSRDVSVQ